MTKYADLEARVKALESGTWRETTERLLRENLPTTGPFPIGTTVTAEGTFTTNWGPSESKSDQVVVTGRLTRAEQGPNGLNVTIGGIMLNKATIR